MTTREECLELDAKDPLSPLRSEFSLADGELYLDGNSLGPISKSARAAVDRVLGEWQGELIRSWNLFGWMDTPLKLGDRIAPLIGAKPGEIVVADTLTFAIAKLTLAALEQRPDRHVILTDEMNFHTDIYILDAVANYAGRPITVKTIDRNDLAQHLNDDVALVEFTHVDFRTGEALDVTSITRQVHDAGALMLWDFAHTTGALPVDVTAANVDFAAGCGYKYLNAGPGSPAYMYVRAEWQDKVNNPLPGWLGHARPFDFEIKYEATEGIRKFVTSSPSILALAALDGALEVFEKTTMTEVRKKSLALTDLFINLVEERLPGQFKVVTPRDHAKRGSQVALAHPEAYGVVQALIKRGVTGDFRAPDIARFGFTPLYLRYVDVYDSVEHLVQVMQNNEHQADEFKVRNAVT
jgi:kynureninase